ncbi:MAG: molybdopterin cofactor-binding domain-containing protein, partial [Chloroflexota bacterium]
HTFTTQLMHQAYIEPHACVVSVEDNGRVQVWVNNKSPFNLREQLAAAWGLPEDRIRLNPCSIGGDFGGKGSFMDVPLCYYLALHARRPVKMVMDYIQELMAGNPRHPGVITLKTGVKEDGRLWARQARVAFNSGAYGAFKPRVHLRGADHSGGPYRIPHLQIDSYMVYTNSVPCGHMRAPAKPQVVFAVESHMDMIARELGLDPYEFRLRNVLRDGDASPTGERWHNLRVEETLGQAAQAAGWGTPKGKPFVGRGMAISDQPSGTGQSAATVTMDERGQVSLLMALWDTGTGAHTILRQVVAEELTVPVEDVRIVVQDTDAVSFDSGSGGSRVTYTAGQAALGAARLLREELIALAGELFECPEERIQLQGGRCLIHGDPARAVPLREVAARAMAILEKPIEAEMTYTSTPSEVTSFCAQVAEVEVDPETGQVRVRKLVTAHDVGTILNPLTHQGQIEGGVIQGLGYALMEEMNTEEGRISTLSLGEYKIPTIEDIPELVTVLLESSAGPAPYGGKSIGESSNVPVAAAIANAVYDAVGVRILDLPITAEKVFRALKGKTREQS